MHKQPPTIIAYLFTLITFIPGFALAASTLNFTYDSIPDIAPKQAIISVKAGNDHAANYKDDLLLSFQNELLINGLDIVIGQENISSENVLSVDVTFSIENGLILHARTEGKYSYFVENISRVIFNITTSSSLEKKQFIELGIDLDTQIIGISDTGYNSIEAIDSVFSRAASLIANLVHASFSDKPDINGQWHDTLGSSIIEFTRNKNNKDFGGYIRSQNQFSNKRTDTDKLAYRIKSKTSNDQNNKGEFKATFLNGDEPAWFPADYIQHGNMLIIKPTTPNSPIGMTFLKKQH
ncbi:MAG: hypothetical protein ABW157_19790 [Candidatus Thiodiazotropha sp. LLP2]